MFWTSLDGYIENLVRFRESVKNDDHKAIFDDMEQTNRIKTILKRNTKWKIKKNTEIG